MLKSKFASNYCNFINYKFHSIIISISVFSLILPIFEGSFEPTLVETEMAILLSILNLGAC